MRRIVVLACLLFSFVAVGVSSAGAAPRSWASPQIQAVVDAGPDGAERRRVPAGRPAHGGRALDRARDARRPGGLRHRPRPSGVDPRARRAARHRDRASATTRGTSGSPPLSAGLTPKQWLGTETVARLLGLRVNHVKTQEQLELQLGQPATRAEAAYSIARVLSISEFELEAGASAARDVRLPAARRLAAGDPRPRAPFRRLAVRLGGNVGAAAAAPRPEAAGRLRLQRASSGASTSSSRSRALTRSARCSGDGRRST